MSLCHLSVAKFSIIYLNFKKANLGDFEWDFQILIFLLIPITL